MNLEGSVSIDAGVFWGMTSYKVEGPCINFEFDRSGLLVIKFSLFFTPAGPFICPCVYGEFLSLRIPIVMLVIRTSQHGLSESSKTSYSSQRNVQIAFCRHAYTVEKGLLDDHHVSK